MKGKKALHDIRKSTSEAMEKEILKERIKELEDIINRKCKRCEQEYEQYCTSCAGFYEDELL